MKLDASAINSLFRLRDESVKKKDYDTFSSTQVEPNLPSIWASGYLELDQLQSEVLHIQSLDGSSVVKKVFVKETYYRSSERPRPSFLIYSVVKTEIGWKIYSVTL